MNLTTLALSLFDLLHRDPAVTVFEANVTPPRDTGALERSLGRLRFSDDSAPTVIASMPEVRLSWGRRGDRVVLGAIGLPGAEGVVEALLERSRSRTPPSLRGAAGEFALDGLLIDARSLPASAVPIDVFDATRARGSANLVSIGRRVASSIVMLRGEHPLPSPGFTLGGYLRLTFATAGLMMLRDVDGGDAAVLGPLLDAPMDGALILPLSDLVRLAVGGGMSPPRMDRAGHPRAARGSASW